MLKVGITGGIGSGKSIVSKVLLSMQYPVFNSDLVSKEIVQGNSEVKQGLITLFGESVFIGNDLNKPFLAEIIFSDKEAREKVNQLVHPKVRAAFDTFVSTQNANIIFNEAAILFETGGHKLLDKTILVTSPEEIRIARVMKRDNISQEVVMARMNAQWSDDKKTPLANFVIVNDDRTPVLLQIEEILQSLSI